MTKKLGVAIAFHYTRVLSACSVIAYRCLGHWEHRPIENLDFRTIVTTSA
jgi:hypothetical protein